MRMPTAADQAMAVPMPSKKRSRYDRPRKAPTPFRKGRKAKRNPDTPWSTAPMLKQVLAPILAPNLPKMGLETKWNLTHDRQICLAVMTDYLKKKRDKLAMPNTNPYSPGVAPFFSASDGKNGGCKDKSNPNAM